MKYEPRLLKQAVDCVKSGLMNPSQAEREFNIPRSTIRLNMKQPQKTVGGRTIFSPEQENKLCDRLIYMCQRGFPLKVADFQKAVYIFGKRLERRKSLPCGLLPQAWNTSRHASDDWWKCFKKRHSSLTLRIAQGLSNARAQAFNQDRVNQFFVDYKDLIDTLQLGEAYGELVYNCDETGLCSVPSSTGKVIAKKGMRNVQQITVGERGTLTTLLLCANAAGDFIPPFLIFKGYTPDEKDYPQYTHLVRTKSGYVDHDTFLDFLRHFQEHRRKVEGKKAILVLDGHSAHLSMEAIEYAMEHSIELICLPPHTTHRLQPLDTHVNKVLKTYWRNELGVHLVRHDRIILTRFEFHLVFNPVWTKLKSRRGLVVDGFSHCGLYPPQNPTTPDEFRLTDNYEANHAAHAADNIACLNSIMSVPLKKGNEAHKKPHVAHISVTENLKSKKEKKGSVPTNQKCAKAVPAKQKQAFDANQPSTSTGIQHLQPAPNKRVPQRKVSEHQTAQKRQRKDDTCCVCQSKWTDAIEEWIRCGVCQKWACETCYLTDCCLYCA
jgi:hypothetical protein